MLRISFSILIFVTLPLATLGQEKAPPRENTFRLELSPAPAPKPALKYLLLPPFEELQPGNPVLGYLKCFSEQHQFFYSKESTEQRKKWLEMPLKDLPVKELRNYGGEALRRADVAARLSTPDWELLPKMNQDPQSLTSDEVRQIRILGLALKVRLRGEIADCRYYDALRTAQTMNAMSRHLGKHPTILGNLLAFGCASWAADGLEEMIGQPESPNLFWALADLPIPILEIRPAIHGEMRFFSSWFEFLDHTETMDEEGMEKALNQLTDLLRKWPKDTLKIQADEVKGWLAKKAEDQKFLASAKARLIESGFSKEKLDKLYSLQIILLDEKLRFDIARQDMVKAISLPLWQSDPILLASVKEQTKLISPLVQLLYYHNGIIRQMQNNHALVAQRLALLRHLEALRIYAAEHHGNLPKSLNDIALPLPLDPVTGKAFQYSLNGDTASLRGGAPSGWDGRRYQITMRKIKN